MSATATCRESYLVQIVSAVSLCRKICVDCLKLTFELLLSVAEQRHHTCRSLIDDTVQFIGTMSSITMLTSERALSK